MDDDFTDEDFHLIGESVLEVDEEETDRAEYLPSAEEALRLIGRDNRVGNRGAQTSADPFPFSSPRPVAYDIGLMLVLHAHPECKFKWSRLVVDLGFYPQCNHRGHGTR